VPVPGTFVSVDKRWTMGLLLAIGIALVGLVAIQLYWIRGTMALQEAQFAQGVENALYAVSDRLERAEALQDVQRHELGRRLLLRLDTLRRPVGMGRANARGGAEDVAPVERELARRTPSLMAVPVPEQLLDSVRNHAGGGTAVDPAAHEALVADILRSILASELDRDIRERLDPGQLDSLLAEEFLAHGLGSNYRHAVFSGGGRQVIPPADEPDADLRDTPFRVRLFRHDLAGNDHYLHVLVPDRQGALLRGMLPMLLVAALFILIIVFAFVQALRMIFRQKRLSEIRYDLVNNLTHELKTPISTIGLACEALADPSIPRTEQQVRTYTGMIRDENKRLGALVENVLQSAVLDGGQMVIKRVELDLHALVQDVVRSSNILLERRNGRMDLDLQAEIHRVQGDRIHLTNLLYNLVDNAVKYTEKEPRITIATRSDDRGITVSVTDNGIGIAASEQRKIFERLYRVPTGNIHNAKGFGLGLSYVRNVVERHGGRIRVDSAPGRGSTFHIFIPFEHARTHEAAAR
jgi:two-component system phosphate regulon sensor histidine kinase PhoR